ETEDALGCERARRGLAVVEDIAMQLKARRGLLWVLRLDALTDSDIRWGGSHEIEGSARPIPQILVMQRYPLCQVVVGHRAARECVADRLHFHHGEVPCSRQFPQCQ